MSLSARIAVRASRWLELVAAAVATGGVIAATVVVVDRWPSLAAWCVASATAMSAFVWVRAYRQSAGSRRHVLSVADRAEIAVSPDDESGDGESWLLDDSTMMWPGFSVIGLRSGDAVHGRRSMRVAMFDSESTPIDRRSLHRFLGWSLRGGQRSDATGPDATERPTSS